MNNLFKKTLCLLLIVSSAFGLIAQNINYFGQQPPGNEPEVFAPDFISTNDMEFYLSFSYDGNMCIFIRVSQDNKIDNIKYVIRENGKWGQIQDLPYYDSSSGINDSYFILDPRTKKIYFASKRPVPGNKENSKQNKMWKMEFVDKQWQKPQFVDLLKESDYGIGHPSITKDGTVYFYSDVKIGNVDMGDIFFSRLKNGKYGEIQNPGQTVNTTANECDPFISPDEKYMLIATSEHPDCLSDDFDIFISFRKKDNSWSKPVNLGKEINSEAREIYPRISPDGKYIFFSSNRSGNWDIYWADAKILEKLRPIEENDFSKYAIAYSSDVSGNPEIYLSDINGKEKLRITDYELRDGYAACSPDCKKIAFYAYYDNARTWSINVMNIDGSNRKRLTTKKYVEDTSPSWSYDGKQIIFTRSENKVYQLWIMNSDGSNSHKLNFPFALHANFLSNSKIIYSTHWKDSGEICIANVDGTDVVQLTNNNSVDGDPKISPDGKQVVFFSGRDGNYEVYKMNIDGSNQTRLTNNDAYDWSASWSPDGSKIAFISNRDGDYDVYIMNSDGSSLRNLTNNDNIELGPNWLKK